MASEVESYDERHSRKKHINVVECERKYELYGIEFKGDFTNGKNMY